MLCLVPVPVLALALVLATCAPQDLHFTPSIGLSSSENTTVGSLLDETLMMAQTGHGPPNLIDNLRRQLMRDNYDYRSGEETTTGVPSSPPSHTTVHTPPTHTVEDVTTPPSTPPGTTTSHAHTDVHHIDLTTYRSRPAIEPLISQIDMESQNPATEPGVDERSVLVNESSPELTYNEPNERVFNKDLLYYMDDDRLQNGFNFRRRNNELDGGDHKMTETLEEYDYNENTPESEEEPAMIVTVMVTPGYRHHHHCAHHKRRKHMSRGALYGARRVYKRIGRRRQHSVNTQNRQRYMRTREQAGERRQTNNKRFRGMRNRLQNRPRYRERGGYPYSQHDRRRRRVKLNMKRRNYPEQMDDNNREIDDKNGRRVGQPRQGDRMLGNYDNSASASHYEKQENDQRDKDYDGHHSAKLENKIVENQNESQQELEHDYEINEQSNLSHEANNDQRTNEPTNQEDENEHGVQQGGRRNNNEPQDKPDVAQDSDQDNSTNVEKGQTKFKYKLLKVRQGHSGRRSGTGQGHILQKSGANGVALIPLDEAPFPQFGLPPARRQYMHERSAARAPLHELLPRAAHHTTR